MNAPGPWYERRGSGSRPETRTCQPHLCLMPNFARFFMHSAFDEFFVKTNRNYQHRYCVYVRTLPRNVHNPMCLCDNTTLQYRSAQIRLFGAHKPQGTTGCEPRKVRARGIIRTAARARGPRQHLSTSPLFGAQFRTLFHAFSVAPKYDFSGSTGNNRV